MLQKTKYPIFIPSKGRANNCKTADLLLKDKVLFTLVVEKEDFESYKSKYPETNILVLPDSNQGIAYVRNYMMKYAEKLDVKYHWQLDDDIKTYRERVDGKNIIVDSFKALTEIENTVNKYKNIAVAGMRDSVFAWTQKKPVSLNKQIASTVLYKTHTGIYFDPTTVTDTDWDIRALLENYCTLLFNWIIYDKDPNTNGKGGIPINTKYNIKRNFVEKWPHYFKLTKDKNGNDKVAPSRIWQSFKQRLIEV